MAKVAPGGAGDSPVKGSAGPVAAAGAGAHTSSPARRMEAVDVGHVQGSAAAARRGGIKPAALAKRSGSGSSGGGTRLAVDMTAHNGLRGAAAVWIVIFHCYGLPKRSEVLLNLQGSTIMPLFFMLSGFSLTVTYGRKLWAEPPSCCRRNNQHAATDGEGEGEDATAAAAAKAIEEGQGQSSSTQAAALPIFPVREFLQNRFARVMPVYLFCLLLCVSLWIVNVGDFPFSRRTFIPSLVTSVIPSTTLLSPLASKYLATLNPPGWFVCTIVFFFLCFPRWLAAAQRLTDRQLVGRIVALYYLQYIFLQGIFTLLPLVTTAVRPFGTATTNPLTRFPLFLMGIYAGILSLRHPVYGQPLAGPPPPSKQKQQQQPQTEMVAIDKLGSSSSGGGGGSTLATMTATATTMPWPTCFLGCFPLPAWLAASSRCGRRVLAPLCSKSPASAEDWARLATWQSAGILAVTLVIAAVDSGLVVGTGGRVALRGHVWLQGLVPMVQLTILVALTREGGASSPAARALSTPVAQWLGKVSMNVYLVHFALIAYLALAVHHDKFDTLLDCYGVVDETETRPDHYAACMQAMEAAMRFPPWGIAVVLPLALVAGEVLFRYVEEPARRVLRSKPRSSNSSNNSSKPTTAVTSAVASK